MASRALGALDSLWPGPRPYSEDRAEFFRGRDEEIGAVLDRVAGQRLSVLLAPSAAGKTSLLQAGVIPELRYMRIAAMESAAATGNHREAVRFPLVLNQWLGRAGEQDATDFAKLLLIEAHRYLRSSLPWYENERREAASLENDLGAATVVALDSEVALVEAAAKGLETLAEASGVAQLDATGALEFGGATAKASLEDRAMVGLLLEIQESLYSNLGQVLLVLDQFEEILGDAVLGRQATLAVESLFKLCPDSVRQLISMRNDSTHLLEPLETGGTMERKRLYTLYPFTPEQVAGIVLEVSALGGLRWAPDALEALTGAFTDAPKSGRGKKDVNLLGLQIVLRSLFADMDLVDDDEVGMSHLKRICDDLAGHALDAKELGEWLRPHTVVRRDRSKEWSRARIAEEAPRRWIERSIEGDVGDADARLAPARASDVEFEPSLLKPMVARMAASLVTPAGFKRPMTGTELQAVAYEDDLVLLRAGDMAGRALQDAWDLDQLRMVLESTFQVALFRLVELGHVLKGRGSGGKAKYELVHDQFGRPLQLWAEAFKSTPEANLGSLYALDNVEFSWGRRERRGARTALASSVRNVSATHGKGGAAGRSTSSVVLAGAKWRGCQIEGVDFSEMVLDSCDLSRTMFRDCLFGAATVLKGCTLDGALFEDSEMSGATFDRCSLDGAAISAGCDATGVTFLGGSMRFADFKGASFADCTFQGADGAQLAMRNLQLVGCTLSGTTTFTACALDGATIGVQADESESEPEPMRPGDLVLAQCDLKGAEFTSMHFHDHALKMTDTTARGAIFVDVTFDARDDGLALEFEDVDLTGAVFIACQLRTAAFRGAERLRDGSEREATKTPAHTLVFKSAKWQPSILDQVEFSAYDMENFSLLDCLLEGPVSFDYCSLSGGTISASEGLQDTAAFVLAALSFTNGCDLTALELRALDFSDSTIAATDCFAASLYFFKCLLPRAQSETSRAKFLRCTMPGVLFQECSVHSLSIIGGTRPSDATALIVRGSGPEHTFGDARFERIDMENFTFERLTIDGPLQFVDCRLSGGTIKGVSETDDEPHLHIRIGAPLLFSAGCELDALEISSALFDGGRMRAEASSCRGMLLLDVDAVSKDAEPILDFEACDLSGAVILDSRIGGMRLRDSVADEALTPAWGLTIRAGTELGYLDAEGYDLDGLVLQNVKLTGPVVFTRCSLLRSRFSDVARSEPGAFIDVQRSDLLFAQVDDDLLEDRPQAETMGSRLFRMEPEQWVASEYASRGLTHMELLA